MLNWIDLSIIGLYFLFMIGVGWYYMRRHANCEEYFVGKRDMRAGHLGFSIVATDVGGGFSIGLGGLGFMMGLSASWLLFTGLVGAWVAAVTVVPRIKRFGDRRGATTFADFLIARFDGRTGVVAALVSGVGYAGFVGSQLLAGGKLGAETFGITGPEFQWQLFGLFSLSGIELAVIIASVVIILYTALGGIEAVIVTDTIQWTIILIGLIFFALPLGYQAVGGWEGLRASLPPGFLSFTNLTWGQFAAWSITIIPIWFIAMTLYQRIYAAADVPTAKRAWYLAGLLEWPLMAFVGAALGMFSRVLYPELMAAGDAELGLPRLIRDVLPVSATGVVLAAYFAAVMSTADSCLIASVGNWVQDIYQRHLNPTASEATLSRMCRWSSVAIGALSVGFALYVPSVLDSILVAYSLMVSGLFFPAIGGLFWRRTTSSAAMWSMIAGGGTTLLLTIFGPGSLGLPVGFDPIFLGLPLSGLVLVGVSLATGSAAEREKAAQVAALMAEAEPTVAARSDSALPSS